MAANGRSSTTGSKDGMAQVLLSVVLEWTLILLLLVNGVFSYLIAKFAAFFRLSPPCILCSRLDHIFEPATGRPLLRDLLCDGHAAEARDMCRRPCSPAPEGELEEKEFLPCPCCGVILEDEFYSYSLMPDPPSPAAPGRIQKGNFIELMVIDEEDVTTSEQQREEEEEEEEVLNQSHKMVAEIEKIQDAIAREENSSVDDASTRSTENANSEERLVPAELVASTENMVKDYGLSSIADSVLGHVRFDQECKALDNEIITLESRDVMEENSPRTDRPERDNGCIGEGEKVPLSDTERGIAMEVNVCDLKQTEIEVNESALDAGRFDAVEVDELIHDANSEEGYLYASAKEKDNSAEQKISDLDGIEQSIVILDATRTLEKTELSLAVEGDDIIEMNSPGHATVFYAEDVLEQDKSLHSGFDTVDSVEENSLFIPALRPLGNSSDNQSFEGMQDPLLHSEEAEQVEAVIDEDSAVEHQRAISEVGQVITTTKSPDCTLGNESSDLEEERAPETPTSVYGVHGLHKRFLFGRTESLDGSVTSEVESCDTLSVEQLRSTLQAKRKALNALYADLEEERNAAAIATNQTMAMINRLQEEKAAMQMEALQYQRMMEEQSEYDQEALQLLNDLLLKRDKEKQELENELEVYRKRVYIYEMRESTISKSKINGGYGRYSASSAENTDDLSIGFQEGDDYALSLDEDHHGHTDDESDSKIDGNTANRIMTVTESLDNFEQERLSVLQELKALELKLFTLEDHNNDDLEDFDNFLDKNGLSSNGDYEYLSDDRHDTLDGFSDDFDISVKLHYERTSKVLRGKMLSPLFDAVSNDNEDTYTGEEVDDASSGLAASRIAKEQNCYSQHQ